MVKSVIQSPLAGGGTLADVLTGVNVTIGADSDISASAGHDSTLIADNNIAVSAGFDQYLAAGNQLKLVGNLVNVYAKDGAMSFYAASGDISLKAGGTQAVVLQDRVHETGWPTEDPAVSGQLWADAASDFVVKVSQG